MKTCSEISCKNMSGRGGLCPKHESRKRRGSKERSYDPTPHPVCAVSHCDLEATSRAVDAMCPPHYQRRYRGQEPEDYILPPTHPARTRPTCSLPGCLKTAISQKTGVCDYHRQQARKGVIQVPEVGQTGKCRFAGCPKPQAQGGHCHSHYEQLRVKGTLKPLRAYGVYVTGEEGCAVPACRGAATSTRLCGRHVQLKNLYKVSAEELIDLWRDPVCSNTGCGETKRLHMDHDHSTGRFRALLCGGCNSALGLLKESTERIQGLKKYIENFQ